MERIVNRIRISTTVAPETHEYLAGLVASGRAATMAEALDQTVMRARNADSAERLARDTAAYFQALSESAAAEESRLEKAVASAAGEINFDQ